MGAKDVLQALLNEFASYIGLSELYLDSEGLCRLLFDDKIELHIQVKEKDSSLMLFAIFATIPENYAKEIYVDMLQANLFWQQTGGATLALDKSSDSAVLVCEHTLIGLYQDKFQKIIQHFVDNVEEWQDRFQQIITKNSSSKAVNFFDYDKSTTVLLDKYL